MKIKVEVREIEQLSMKDGTKFNQVTLLEADTISIKNWLVWSVMPRDEDLLKGVIV